MKKKMPLKTLYFVSGLSAGLFFVHPYVMLVLMLTSPDGNKGLRLDFKDVSSFVHLIFSSEMWPMSFAFISFSGAIGLLIGMVVERERTLAALRYENERRTFVIQAIRQLVMILSHHFLNAVLVIGANVKQLKVAADLECKTEALKKIETQAMKTESIISLLQGLDFERLLDGSEQGYKKIIEISSELERQLKRKKDGD